MAADDSGSRAANDGGHGEAERVMLGNVDVTGIDLTEPFRVDFSVPADASLTLKRSALESARYAHEAFEPVKRRWLIKVDLDLVRTGRCVIVVYPTPRVA